MNIPKSARHTLRNRVDMELDSRRRGVDGVEFHGDGAVMELNVMETGR